MKASRKADCKEAAPARTRTTPTTEPPLCSASVITNLATDDPAADNTVRLPARAPTSSIAHTGSDAVSGFTCSCPATASETGVTHLRIQTRSGSRSKIGWQYYGREEITFIRGGYSASATFFSVSMSQIYADPDLVMAPMASSAVSAVLTLDRLAPISRPTSLCEMPRSSLA